MTSSASRPAHPWRKLLAGFFAALALIGVVLGGALAAFDPYGATPLRRSGEPALMDLNQRYMYPQVIRTHLFDGAVFGTSTVRLLDPKQLDAAFGARTANFAMNSATAWEQAQIAALFLRETAEARIAIFGIDPLWCAEDADSAEKRITSRGFPDSFYDANPWNDWRHLFNLRSIEIAWRLALHRLGLMAPRLPLNGYEVFTPDERAYDLGRARVHIYDDTGFSRDAPANAPPAPDVDRAVMRFPALAWLDDLLARTPAGAIRLVVFPPAHAAGIYPTASREGARLEECKARVAAIAGMRGATMVDFRLSNPITRDDSNFWDHLHYRLPIARRIEQGLADAWATGRDDPDGFYKVPTWSGRSAS